MNSALRILSIENLLIRCDFLVYIDADRFGLREQLAFPPFTDKASTGISNDVVFQLNPFWTAVGILTEHVIKHVGKFLRVTFSEPVFVVLQSLHVNARVLVSVAFILVL